MPRGPAVGQAAVGELGRIEEAGQELVLQVENRRRRGRLAHGRQHQAQGEMDRAQLVHFHLPLKGAGPSGGEGHGEQPARGAGGGAVAADGLHREPGARVRREAGQEDTVVVPASGGERLEKLPDVGLGTAHPPRHQGQEADADRAAPGH